MSNMEGGQVSAEHKGEYPCPCRGCVTSYDAGYKAGYLAGYKAGYLAGYNDHARSQALGAELYGSSKCKDATCWCNRSDVQVSLHIQHGQGENP